MPHHRRPHREQVQARCHTCHRFLFFLALCSPVVLGATFPGTPDRTVYFSPTGTDTAGCGDQSSPCGSLSEFIQDIAKPNVSLSYRLLLSPGQYKVGPTGLDVTNLKLSIQSTVPPAYPGAPAASIDCGGATCLVANCASSACSTDAVLEIVGVDVTNGVSKTDGGCIQVQRQSLVLKSMWLSKCSAARSGGAVLIVNAPSLDAANVTLTGSTASTGDGGGFALVNVTQASFFGLVASGCSATLGSGGVINATLSVLSITDSFLSSSSSNAYGGCVSTHSSTVVVSGSTISGCTAVQVGGCLSDDSSTNVTITGSIITGCATTATISSVNPGKGGCIGAFMTSSIVLNSTTVSKCNASGEGACTFIFGADATTNLLTISDSNIQGCNLTTKGGGGGGLMGKALNVTMRDSRFINNTAWGYEPGSITWGGAIVCRDCGLDIQRCNFSGNSATGFGVGYAWGGAIYTTDEVQSGPHNPNSFTDCRLERNTADVGGAFYLEASGVATVANCVFENNSAVVGEAGAYYVSMTGTVTDTVFENNSAGLGGAILVTPMAAGVVTFSRCNFSSNRATGNRGGAVFIKEIPDFDILFDQCNFKNNSAPLDMGGAVSSSAMLVTFRSCFFEANSAELKGGAIHTGSPDMLVLDADESRPIAGNTALQNCTFYNNQAALGGGAIYVESQGQINSSDCEFAGNTAILGGAVLAEDYSSLVINGGKCRNNSAVAGGGCFTVGELTRSNVRGLVLSNNTAGSEGGAVRTTGQARMVLDSCTLQGNSAMQGGAMWVEMGSVSNLTGCNFVQNHADLNGGGLFVLHNADMSITDSNFTSNSALHGGALSAEGDVHLNITSCQFTSNAIHAVEFEGGVIATVSSSSFSSNNGSSADGGAFLTGDTSVVTLSFSNFSNNIGNRGAGVFADGHSTITVEGCSFLGNSAAEGGGIFAGGYANLTAVGCIFNQNNATTSGAGIALTESTQGILADSAFLANAASTGGAAVYIIRGPVASSMGSAALLRLPSPYIDQAAGTQDDSTGNLPSKFEDESAMDAAGFVVKPMEISNLTFNGNKGPGSQGSAYMDASFDNSSRSSCDNCTTQSHGDSVGTLPTQFRILWPGSNDSDPSVPFIVRGDKFSPIKNLSIQVLDASGALATEDFSAVASIQPSPVISGVLHAVAVLGETEMPPLYIFQAPADGSSTADLTLTVSSSTGAFAPVARQLRIVFCPAGQYYQPDDKSCATCPVGSWCGTALGVQACDDGTFSFFPGATSRDSCLKCPDNEFANGTQAVVCANGTFTVEPGWWLDPDSIDNSEPAVYSCDVLNGCGGFNYSNPQQDQCSAEYAQVRLCSTCESGFYSVLKECLPCQATFTQLFPLFVVLMVLAWFAMGILSNAFHTVAIFIIEIQLLTFIGTYNLLFPTWVTSIIQYFQISLFIPDIIGPPCTMTYEYPAKWAVAMIIPAAGVLIFSILYALLEAYIFILERKARWYSAPYSLSDPSLSTRSLEDGTTATGAPLSQHGAQDESGRDMGALTSRTESGAPPGPDVAAKQEKYSKWRNSLIHGCTNWLDLCYAGVTYRCLQAFYPQLIYNETVMGAAPTIGWLVSPHTWIFSLSVVITLVFVIGAPLGYALVLTWGKLKVLLSDPIFKRRWGWMISRYEYEYFWWHLTVFARRISFASIAVFGVHSPEVQLCVTISLQAVRIGLQYGASPFKAFSHDILNSMFALAEFLFTIALASFHYLNLEEASMVVFGFSMALLLGPPLVILLYEALNMYIDHCNQARMTGLWRLDKLGKSTKSLRRLNRLTMEELVHPRDIAEWFRPHVLYAFLNHATPKEAKILLKVRDRYQACKLAGLGRTDWIKHLTKSQLYAVVSQALLGAAVGEVTIARMPVKSGVTGQGIDEVQIETGAPAVGGQPVRPRNEVTWPPRLEEHVRWTGSGRLTDDSSSVGTSMRHDTSTEDQQHAQHVSAGSEAVIAMGDVAPVPIPVPVADLGDETQRREATDSVPELRRSASVASGRAGSDAGWLSPLQAGGFNQSPLSSSPAAAPLGLPPRPPSSHSGRPRSSASGLPRGPSPLGMAPSGTQTVPQDQDTAPATDSEEPEFLEARMNMADLTLTFQRHLALLVRSEFGKTDDSLRLLLRSDSLPMLLAWLTSPASTSEDQVLLREMVNVVREGAREEAGGLHWHTGLPYFLRNMWRRDQGCKPTLADISS